MPPRLTPVDWKVLVRVFELAGFEHTRTEGSHLILTKAGIARPVVIQQGKEVPKFIIQNNLRTARISRAEYFRLLDQAE